MQHKEVCILKQDEKFYALEHREKNQSKKMKAENNSSIARIEKSTKKERDIIIMQICKG